MKSIAQQMKDRYKNYPKSTIEWEAIEEIERLTAELTACRQELNEALFEVEHEKHLNNFNDELGTEFSVKQAVLIRQAISLLLRREGMVWVPEEPTIKMANAGAEDLVRSGFPALSCDSAECYKAMLKAAKDKK